MSAAAPVRSPRLSLRAASVVLALCGIGISGYLTVVHFTGAAPVCAIAHGCAVVQQSAYAKIGGVPVAVLGLGGYAAIIAALARDGEAWRTACAFLSLAGVGFSAWLTWIEVAVLQAICAWCVASAVFMTALACVSVGRMLSTPPAVA